MNRTIRIRNKKVDVELSFWKLLPVFITILLLLISTGMASGEHGALPPMAD